MKSLFFKDLKILWNNKISLLIFLLIPPILVFILFKALSPIFLSNVFIKPFIISVVDYDKSMGSQMAISSLSGEGYISKVAKVEVVNEEKANDLLKTGGSECVVIIPPDFSRSLYYGENKPIKVYVNSSSKVDSQLIKNFLGNAADLVAAAQSGIYTVYHLMLKSGIGSEKAYYIAEGIVPDFMLMSMGRNEIFETIEASQLPQTNPTEYYLICVSIMFIMFTGILGIRLITQDFENGVINKIVIAPVNIVVYVIEKMLVVISLGFIEFLITALPAALFFKISISLINMQVIITVITVILASVSFCILIALLVKSSSYSVMSSIIGLFLLALIGGCIYPTALMTNTMKTVSQFSFASWGIEALSWAVTEGNHRNLIGTWIMMTVISLVFLTASLVIIAGRRKRFITKQF